MLKQCTALVLLLAFAAMTFSKAVIVVNFYVNRDYIAKNLCENRDKPMLHCCGRCQLRKRLAKEDNQDKNNPDRKSENRNEVLFCQDVFQGVNAPFTGIGKSSYYTPVFEGPVDRPSDFFHPPAC
jgi:hypothetical protein